MRISDWSSDVCSSDLPAQKHRRVERVVVRDIELVEHRAARHAADRIGDPDPHRAVLVMADHRDHRMLETGIADARQREQQLAGEPGGRSEEHTSELQSLMRNSYAVFCLKKKHIST